MSKKSRRPLTAKDYAWIIGVTVAIVGLIPLIASFGAVIQIGFVLLMPIVVIGASVHAFLTEVERIVHKVQGVEVPTDVMLHERHVWAKKTSSKVVVAGVDDFAQRLLGPAEAFEAKRVGTKVQAGDVVATLERAGRKLPVRAPIAGTVAYVNPAVESDPSIVNRSCYERGWIVELTPEPGTLKQALSSLIGKNGAVKWMRSEIDKLVAMTAPPELGHTLADGGEVGRDVSSSLDEETWKKVEGAFFG
jgi:glycine cleavage system H protein